MCYTSVENSEMTADCKVYANFLSDSLQKLLRLSGQVSSVFYYEMALSDVDVAVLAMVEPDIHIQPECRCPSSHPRVTNLFCEDVSGTSQLERINQNSRDITHINDRNSDTFWQSMREVAPVNITISLGGLRTALVISIHFRSVPPGAMVVHYSTDGENFSPRQYFSSDCSVFNLTDNGLLRTPTDVNCITTHSVPATDHFAEFRVLDIGNRPGASDYLLTPSLQSFAEATHIRLELIQFLTTSPDEENHFSINEIIVKGQGCVCNGHADSCTEEATCFCQHNTTGPHCESCLPLYNNEPWAQGTVSSTSECEPCECNGHADACEYEPELGSGVCLNCTGNTVGSDCGSCAEFYYNPPGTPFDSEGSCVECSCDAAGVASESLDCAHGDRLDGGDSGQCECKIFASGRTCSECSDGFFNLSVSNPEGCQSCECDTLGTLEGRVTCDKDTGQCECRENVEGRDCSVCVSQHYGLGEGEGSVGCLECDSECNECTGPGPQQCVVSQEQTSHSNFTTSPSIGMCELS